MAHAFRANFDDGLEDGAAVCVYAGGRPVVDLFGGTFRRDSLAVVWSTTKGAMAIAVLLLAERGLLDLDRPVADYWPEFASGGKHAVPVRWLLTHQAGLAAVDASMTYDDFLAGAPMARALAAQRPLWEPGTAFGYHAFTYGWLLGELVWRVTGMTAGSFFHEEIAGPLGLYFWIGLPEEEEARVVPIKPPPLPAPSDPVDPSAVAMRDRATLAHRIAVNPAFPPGSFNSRGLHAAEVPAASGITDARSLARLYAACVGEVDGHGRLLSDETVDRARATQVRGPSIVEPHNEMHNGLGFMLPTEKVPMAGEGSFGHDGAGGSLGFAHPERGIGFGYVMNQMGPYRPEGDTRTRRLCTALRACL